MGVLRNGLNLLGVSSLVQQIVIGAVIIGAVLADTATRGGSDDGEQVGRVSTGPCAA